MRSTGQPGLCLLMHQTFNTSSIIAPLLRSPLSPYPSVHDNWLVGVGKGGSLNMSVLRMFGVLELLCVWT